MKLKQLKKILDGLTPSELNKELLYNSDRNYISGAVLAFKKNRFNRYYTGEDDPCLLYTKSQLKSDGYSEEDISEMDIEIKKGEYIIEL